MRQLNPSEVQMGLRLIGTFSNATYQANAIPVREFDQQSPENVYWYAYEGLVRACQYTLQGCGVEDWSVRGLEWARTIIDGTSGVAGHQEILEAVPEVTSVIERPVREVLEDLG